MRWAIDQPGPDAGIGGPLRLTFLGTRGYIKGRTERHNMHSSLLVEFRSVRIILDWGEDWLDKTSGLEADAILVTHAHPDHSWGLKRGAPCAVFASPDSWESMKNFDIPGELRHVARNRQPTTIKGVTFEAFEVEHSTRAPAVGYRVTAGRRSLFYAPDLVYIHERAEALSGADVYVGDGATVARSMVRKRGDALIGHVPIQTQLTWCKKEGVPRAVFTHCGSQIVSGDEGEVTTRIGRMALERGVKVIVAYDGMRLLL